MLNLILTTARAFIAGFASGFASASVARDEPAIDPRWLCPTVHADADKRAPEQRVNVLGGAA